MRAFETVNSTLRETSGDKRECLFNPPFVPDAIGAYCLTLNCGTGNANLTITKLVHTSRSRIATSVCSSHRISPRISHVATNNHENVVLHSCRAQNSTYLMQTCRCSCNTSPHPAQRHTAPRLELSSCTVIPSAPRMNALLVLANDHTAHAPHAPPVRTALRLTKPCSSPACIHHQQLGG